MSTLEKMFGDLENLRQQIREADKEAKNAVDWQEAFAAGVIQGVIKVLFNSEKEKFAKIFGSNGHYLWSKYKDHFNSNEGEFICYLDDGNLKKLAAEAITYYRDPASWNGEE